MASEQRPSDLEQFEARVRGCDVILHCDEACAISAKPELLRSAIENVVRNAIRYTAPSTAIEIVLDCRAAPGCVRLRVRDHGPRVPESDLQRIFERFYRAGPNGRSEEGTGLGLAITQRVATLHGCGPRMTHRGGLIVTLELPIARHG